MSLEQQFKIHKTSPETWVVTGEFGRCLISRVEYKVYRIEFDREIQGDFVPSFAVGIAKCYTAHNLAIEKRQRDDGT